MCLSDWALGNVLIGDVTAGRVWGFEVLFSDEQIRTPIQSVHVHIHVHKDSPQTITAHLPEAGSAPPPPRTIRQGTAVLEEQQRQISAAVDRALTLQLGGSTGAGLGWGRALGCRVSGDLVGWRSALGNALAKRSLEMGLEPVGVVAYVEVRGGSLPGWGLGGVMLAGRVGQGLGGG